MVGLTELGRAIGDVFPQGSTPYHQNQRLLAVAEYVPSVAEQIRANIIDDLNQSGRPWLTLPLACVYLGVTRQTLTRRRDAWSTTHGIGWKKDQAKNAPVLFHIDWLRKVKQHELDDEAPIDAFQANKGTWRHLKGLASLSKMVKVLVDAGGNLEDIVVTGLSPTAEKALRAAGMFVRKMSLLDALTQHPWKNTERLAQFEAWFEHEVMSTRRAMALMKAQGEQQRIEALRSAAFDTRTKGPRNTL